MNIYLNYFLAAFICISKVTSEWTQVGSDIGGEAVDDNSGTSLAMSANGTIVAIGAIWNDGNGTSSGHTRVYRNANDIWLQIGSDIDGESNYDYSGVALVMSADGSVIAVGAHGNDGNGTRSGHTRVYRNANDIWVQVGNDIDGEAADDESGTSLAMSVDGSVIAVSALYNDGNGFQSGHARVYRNVNDVWMQVGSDIDGEAVNDYSGRALAMSADGSMIAVGAHGNDGNGFQSGHARVYRNVNDIWIQVGSDIDGEAEADQSGLSLAMSTDGSVIAIGAPYNDGNGLNSGHARVYRNVNDVWVQIGSDIDGEAANDESGISLAMSADGSVIAIGAHTNDGNGLYSGQTRVYRNINDSWVQVGSDINGENAYDQSGISLAMSADGSVLAIGAPYNGGNGDDTGHTRIFSYTLDESTTLPTTHPTQVSSNTPTKKPSIKPSEVPTKETSFSPSKMSSGTPSIIQTVVNTEISSRTPSSGPSALPTQSLSQMPSKRFSSAPSLNSTNRPTSEPSSMKSPKPSLSPSSLASVSPTSVPSNASSKPTSLTPSLLPSNEPTVFQLYLPSRSPSSRYFDKPTNIPSHMPSMLVPSAPSMRPSIKQTSKPTIFQIISHTPTETSSSRAPSRYSSNVPSLESSIRNTSISSQKPIGFESSFPVVVPDSLHPSEEPSNANRIPSPTTGLLYSPSYLPSVSPSISPTIIQSESTVINSESYHDIPENNSSSLEEYLQQFDSDYLSFLKNDTLDLSDHPYGGSDVENYSPFVVSEIQSLVIDNCTPINESDSCYNVKSSISVIHHPILFTTESIDLVITDSSNSFFNEKDRVRSNAYNLVQAYATITVTLVGVGDSRVMDDEEREIFEESLLQFFNNELLSENNNYPFVRVATVELLSQSLEESFETSYDTNGEDGLDTIVVTVSVNGVYLPPPEIIFDQVLVETLDEEGDDDFIEILNNDADSVGETFFNSVHSAIGSLTDEDGDEMGIFEIILVLVGIVIGLVALLISFAYIRKSIRKNREKKFTEQLREHHQENILQGC